MRGLRITLDKSAVYGLHNHEVDSMDRYFFQIVPHSLVNEILADLTKTDDHKSSQRIAAHTYRISGNHGLTLSHQTRLINSLMGYEVPMDGRFLPSGETLVRTTRGSIATIIETPLEDEVLSRWQRGEFSPEENGWAAQFRSTMEMALDYKKYVSRITSAEIEFQPPKSIDELIATADRILNDQRFTNHLFAILAEDFNIGLQATLRAIERWNSQGNRSFVEFAPYAAFCLRASLLWHLSLTNSQLFSPDRNDRKDLEYCFYLPNTQIFASRDKKQLTLMSALIREDQSLVNADDLKADLKRTSVAWDLLTNDERIAQNARRGAAPPELEDSLLYQLWKKHDGELRLSRKNELENVRFIDDSLPREQQVPFTLSDFLQAKIKEITNGTRLTREEIDELHRIHNGRDPSSIKMFNTRTSRKRFAKWYPELSEDTLEEMEVQNEVYLDPSEYSHIVTADS